MQISGTDICHTNKSVTLLNKNNLTRTIRHIRVSVKIYTNSRFKLILETVDIKTWEFAKCSFNQESMVIFKKYISVNIFIINNLFTKLLVLSILLAPSLHICKDLSVFLLLVLDTCLLKLDHTASSHDIQSNNATF